MFRAFRASAVLSISAAAIAGGLQVPTEWTADTRELRCLTTADDTLTIDPCAGWVRGQPAFDLFVARFEVRPLTPDARGLFGISTNGGSAPFGVAVPLTGVVAPGAAPPNTLLVGLAQRSFESARARRNDDWLAYTITRSKNGISVSLNGVELVVYNPPAARNGAVGFRALAGAIEVRSVSYDAAGLPMNSTPRADQAPTLTMPHLLRQVKPNYTPEARAAKIQGTAIVECVVLADGSVSNAKIIRSLDSQFGLDDEALKAARQYRFAAATRNGTPVPTTIQIEITFRLAP